jgi:hypothetical protein
MRRMYRESDGNGKAAYELEYEQVLQKYVDDCDRRIKISQLSLRNMHDIEQERDLVCT